MYGTASTQAELGVAVTYQRWTPMNRRPRTRIWATAFASAALLSLSACSGGGPSESTNDAGNLTTSMVGGQGSVAYAPLQLIDELGADTKNGLELDYRSAESNSANMIAALLSRDVDFAAPAAQAAIDAIQEGADLMIVAVPNTLNFLHLVVRTDVAETLDAGPDDSLEERLLALKGKRIATSPSGSGNNAVLRALITSVGLDPDKDVQIIGVADKGAIPAGITAGTFDAAMYTNGVLEQGIVQGDTVSWVATSSGEAADVIGEATPAAFIVTRRDVAENAPAVVDAVIATVNSVLESAQNNPEEFKELMGTEVFSSLNPAVYEEVWATSSPAFTAESGLSREALEDIKGLQGGTYDKVAYDRVVYPGAQK